MGTNRSWLNARNKSEIPKGLTDNTAIKEHTHIISRKISFWSIFTSQARYVHLRHKYKKDKTYKKLEEPQYDKFFLFFYF